MSELTTEGTPEGGATLYKRTWRQVFTSSGKHREDSGWAAMTPSRRDQWAAAEEELTAITAELARARAEAAAQDARTSGQSLPWPFSEIIAIADKLQAEAAQIERNIRDIGWTREQADLQVEYVRTAARLRIAADDDRWRAEASHQDPVRRPGARPHHAGRGPGGRGRDHHAPGSRDLR